APPAAGGGAGAARAPSSAAAPPAGLPPIVSLLPHRPPMLFLTRVVGVAEDGLTCEARVPSGCGLVEDGTAPALAVLEAAAQCAGAWEALRRAPTAEAGPRVAHLLRLHD